MTSTPSATLPTHIQVKLCTLLWHKDEAAEDVVVQSLSVRMMVLTLQDLQVRNMTNSISSQFAA